MTIDTAHVVTDDTDLFDLAETMLSLGDLAVYRYERSVERISVSLDRDSVYAVATIPSPAPGIPDVEVEVGEYRDMENDTERRDAVKNLASDMLAYWRAGA